MNAFQIQDSNGNGIPLNTLDKEAAEFCKVDLHSKEYAKPNHCSSNWFDMIGWYIANPCNMTTGWINVKTTILAQAAEWACYSFLKSKVNMSISDLSVAYQPYLDLIDHWETKGYSPKQIKE